MAEWHKPLLPQNIMAIIKIGRTTAFRPDPEVEKRSRGHGKVHKRKMTLEEYERYFGGLKERQTDSNGKEIRQPIVPNLPTEKPIKKVQEEEKQVTAKRKGKWDHVTKEFLEKEFAKGKKPGQIEKSLGMSSGVIYNIMKRHGLKSPFGPSGKLKDDQQAIQTTKSKNKDQNNNELHKEITRLRNEIDALKSQLKSAEEHAIRDAARVNELEEDNKRLKLQMEDANGYEIVDCQEIEPDCYISFQIPIISSHWHPIEQRVKVQEELNEFASEIESQTMNRERAASELFDLMQAYVGLIRSDLVDLLPGQDVTPLVDKFIKHHQQMHHEKIQKYAVERGWKVS